MVSKEKEYIISTYLPILIGAFQKDMALTQEELESFSTDELFSKLFIWALTTNRIKGFDWQEDKKPKINNN